MTRILVTRPGGASVRWRSLGTVIDAPVLRIEALAWLPPEDAPDAVMLTSANGVRCAGPQADAYHRLPAFAVGTATATAARGAGWRDVRDGGGTVTALFDAVVAMGFARVLHLAGADRTVAAAPHQLSVEVRNVYAAVPIAMPAAALELLATGAIDLAPLYSPRSAAEFARQVDAAGIDRAGVTLAAISPATAAAVGTGWRHIGVAALPTDEMLFDTATALLAFAAAAGVCDNAL